MRGAVVEVMPGLPDEDLLLMTEEYNNSLLFRGFGGQRGLEGELMVESSEGGVKVGDLGISSLTKVMFYIIT